MLQLLTYEVKEPNLKLYMEIKLISTEGRGKDKAPFCRRTWSWRPAIWCTWAMNTKCSPPYGWQFCIHYWTWDCQVLIWMETVGTDEGGRKTNHLKIKYNKIIKSKWGYCFKNHAEKNPWMILTFYSNETNSSVSYSILIHWYLFQDINKHLISVLLTSTIKSEVIRTTTTKNNMVTKVRMKICN